MLAKIWKKVLFAICIIACIYNVMNKLVSRTSLEMQLKSVMNQASIIDSLKNENTEKNSNVVTENPIEKSNNFEKKEIIKSNDFEKEDASDYSNEIDEENKNNNSIVVIY